MRARVLPFDPEDPDVARLAPLVEALERGEVVAVPTETFYGLAADPFDPAAVRRVHALKHKPPGSPVLLLLADVEQADRVCGTLPARFATLAERFWPGPLTLVVPADPGVPAEVTGGRGTVAVRVPGHPLPRRLARAFGRPITGVSANRTGEPPCRTAAEVARALGDQLSIVADGGRTPGDAPSTIVDLSGPTPRLLRNGLLAPRTLLPYLDGDGGTL